MADDGGLMIYKFYVDGDGHGDVDDGNILWYMVICWAHDDDDDGDCDCDADDGEFDDDGDGDGDDADTW